MGISYSAKIMVGIQRAYINDNDRISELLEEDVIEDCSPSYDGNYDDDAVVGFTYVETNSYSSQEVTWDQAEIDALKAKFFELTGQKAQVWVSPHGH